MIETPESLASSVVGCSGIQSPQDPCPGSPRMSTDRSQQRIGVVGELHTSQLLTGSPSHDSHGGPCPGLWSHP